MPLTYDTIRIMPYVWIGDSKTCQGNLITFNILDNI